MNGLIDFPYIRYVRIYGEGKGGGGLGNIGGGGVGHRT